jgi:transposase
LILPTVNQDCFEIALERFARAVGAGPEKRIILVLDGAGWHRAHKLNIPEGIHLMPLPAYSPELQPAERLWPLVRESLANKNLETLDELEEIISARCRYLLEDTQLISSHTKYHWWPSSELS